MRARNGQLFGAVLAASSSFVSGTALARDDGTAEQSQFPIRLTYAAPSEPAAAGCPSFIAFREGVRARAPELRDAEEGEVAREFAAELSRQAAQSVADTTTILGRLTIRDETGGMAIRRVAGTTCVEVVNALAFIVAELGRSLRIEANGASTVAPAPAVPETPEGTPGPGTFKKNHRVVKTRLRVRTESTSPPMSVEPQVARSRDQSRWYLEAGFGLEATLAPAPDWLLGAAPHVEVGWEPNDRARRVSARLSALKAQTGTLRSSLGRAQLDWEALRLDACGPTWTERGLRVSACGSCDFGRLRGVGTNTSEPQTRQARWLAPGMLVRGQWAVLGPLVLELQAAVFVPLVRPEFFFASDTSGVTAGRQVVHEVPAIGYRLAPGLGVHFQ